MVCRHVEQVQERLGRRLLVENPSTYVQFAHSSIPEWEFVAELAARTGCGMLCDINNIFVSASNHGWDASRYVQSLPPHIVGEIHLAAMRCARCPMARRCASTLTARASARKCGRCTGRRCVVSGRGRP